MHKHVDDVALPFDFAAGKDDHSVPRSFAIPLIDIGTYDEVGDTSFVLNGHKNNARSRGRPLAHQHDARNGGGFAVRPARFIFEMTILGYTQFIECSANKADWVSPKRKTC